MEELQNRATQQVEETILDILLNPPRFKQQAESEAEGLRGEEPKNVTREHFREKLRHGALDHHYIEIQITDQVPTGSMPPFNSGPVMDERMFVSFQAMFSNFFPKPTKRKKVTVAEARELLLNEEIMKLLGMNAVKEEALAQQAMLVSFL